MAIRYAVANGNWSNPATWDGGTLPGNGDDVYANGKTITIDINLVGPNRPAKLIARGPEGGTAGGTFNVTTTRQIGENGAPVEVVGPDAASTIAINFTGASGTTLTIYGNVSGGNQSSARGVYNTDVGTVTINGNVSGGSNSNADGAYNAWTGTIIINGNVSGGSGSGAYGVRNNSTGTITVNGSVSGGSGSSAVGVYNSSTGTITINGNVSGGLANTADGLYNISSNTITINGDVAGGFYSAAYGVNNTGNSAITINGNVRPTSIRQAGYAVYNASGTITINGDVYGGRGNAACYANGGLIKVNGDLRWDSSLSNAPAVATSASGILSLKGNIRNDYLIESLGLLLINGRVILRNGSDYLTQYAEDNGSGAATGNPIYHDGLNRSRSNFPAENHVRQGVIYGPANEFVGTVAIPSPAQVAQGVPVDNSVGTAVLTTDDLAAAAWQTLIDGNLTSKQLLALIAAAHLGLLNGAGSDTVTIKAVNDGGTTRIVALVDSFGNRLNVVLTPP